jgi:hypothetical protein
VTVYYFCVLQIEGVCPKRERRVKWEELLSEFSEWRLQELYLLPNIIRMNRFGRTMGQDI